MIQRQSLLRGWHSICYQGQLHIWKCFLLKISNKLQDLCATKHVEHLVPIVG